jgi:hypothetical protein
MSVTPAAAGTGRGSPKGGRREYVDYFWEVFKIVSFLVSVCDCDLEEVRILGRSA